MTVSDHTTTEMSTHESTAVTEEPLFDDAELREFDRADVEAGRGICKMLSLFFFYTVIVMAISTIVTWKWISQ
jgi:hypothetical protein